MQKQIDELCSGTWIYIDFQFPSMHIMPPLRQLAFCQIDNVVENWVINFILLLKSETNNIDLIGFRSRYVCKTEMCQKKFLSYLKQTKKIRI